MSDITILEPAIAELEAELAGIEYGVLTEGFTLADAIREGSTVTGQKVGGWADTDGNACALSAAFVAVKAHGLIS
jgi:hypothetical protein